MDRATSIRELAAQVREEELRLHLARLPSPRSRATAPEAVEATLTYLREVFATCSWQVADQPCQDPVLGSGLNLLATWPGDIQPELLVVVGAHHDTVPESPGADDNGSGLTGLLEIARVIGQRRWATTLQLVAFDFEETGFFGSRAYVDALRRTPGVHLIGALILEMIGYRDLQPRSQQLPPGARWLFRREVGELERRGSPADFLVALANRRAAALLRQFAAAAALAAPDLPVFPLKVPRLAPLADLYLSDHVPFWQAGLPAVQLTDTAYLRNPYYHGPDDRPETLDPRYWRLVVSATVATAATLAGLLD
jgi:Zn-dependent M28 family amino/carboxypeptidase